MKTSSKNLLAFAAIAGLVTGCATKPAAQTCPGKPAATCCAAKKGSCSAKGNCSGKSGCGGTNSTKKTGN
ncbi:hypothetical protein BH09VER1_BH09VER1_45110 [soil metagenome]